MPMRTAGQGTPGIEALVERQAARWSLDYGLFDTAIVGEIARQRGIDESLVAGLDERMRGAIDRYVAEACFVATR